jgi:hypothetical protein
MRHCILRYIDCHLCLKRELLTRVIQASYNAIALVGAAKGLYVGTMRRTLIGTIVPHEPAASIFQLAGAS